MKFKKVVLYISQFKIIIIESKWINNYKVQNT